MGVGAAMMVHGGDRGRSHARKQILFNRRVRGGPSASQHIPQMSGLSIFKTCSGDATLRGSSTSTATTLSCHDHQEVIDLSTARGGVCQGRNVGLGPVLLLECRGREMCMAHGLGTRTRTRTLTLTAVGRLCRRPGRVAVAPAAERLGSCPTATHSAPLSHSPCHLPCRGCASANVT